MISIRTGLGTVAAIATMAAFHGDFSRLSTLFNSAPTCNNEQAVDTLKDIIRENVQLYRPSIKEINVDPDSIITTADGVKSKQCSAGAMVHTEPSAQALAMLPDLKAEDFKLEITYTVTIADSGQKFWVQAKWEQPTIVPKPE